MATYKVIQDIESEDKLLGPLTLRQFVYAAIVVMMGFLAFKLAAVSSLFVVPFILPMAFFSLLAAPFGHDQSSEVWLLAKIGFFLKPRRRIWDQGGMQELVTITAPKKLEQHLTDGLTQMEVKSRLQALANTIDSRGWAVKNVNVNLFNQPSYLTSGTGSDRLVDGSSLPQAVPNYEIVAADDILDETSNPTAQHLDAMISQSEQAHRETLVAAVRNGPQPAAPPADYWFMNQSASPPQPKPGYATFDGGSTIAPGATPADDRQVSDSGTAEQELLNQIHRENSRPNPAYGHMRVLDPAGAKQTSQAPPSANTTPMRARQDNAKADLARLAANDDLNVSTIAREANKAAKQPPDDEVVISLR